METAESRETTSYEPDTTTTRGSSSAGDKSVDQKYGRTRKRNELTVCGLCHKDLFAPKNFPCLHSFCEMCVTDYVTTCKRTNKTKGATPTIVCPICETPTTFRSVSNPKEFAENLQSSTLMTSILSKNAEKIRECNLCPQVEKKGGQYWCFYCAQALCDEHESYHKAITSSKIKHPVYPLKNVRDVPDSLYKSQHCRFHEKNAVANFCMDHLNACCSVCWKRMHRVCNVIPIEQAARIVHKSKISMDLEYKIDYLLVKVNDTLEERQKHMEDLEKQRKSSLRSIQNFRKTLDSYIDSLQANMEHDIEHQYTQTKEQLEKEIHEFQNKRSNFEHFNQLLKAIGEFSQPIQSLSELTDIQQQCNDIEQFIGRSLFQMKNVRLSTSFISIQQIAHVISKLGTAVLLETSKRTTTFRPANDTPRTNTFRSANDTPRSRSDSYNPDSSRRLSRSHKSKIDNS